MFSCEFCKILRTLILKNISGRLLLFICSKQLSLEAAVQMYSQRQSPRGVMWKNTSYKIRKFDRKMLLPEPLYLFLTKLQAESIFLWILRNF